MATHEVGLGLLAPRSSDTSDEQWAVIEPQLPAVKTGGRPEKHPRGR
jgi:transposase